MVRDPGERHGQGEEGILMHLPHLSQVIYIQYWQLKFDLLIIMNTYIQGGLGILSSNRGSLSEFELPKLFYRVVINVSFFT